MQLRVVNSLENNLPFTKEKKGGFVAFWFYLIFHDLAFTIKVTFAFKKLIKKKEYFILLFNLPTLTKLLRDKARES